MSIIKSIEGNTLTQVYESGLWHIDQCGYVQNTRGGKVRRAPGPVVTTYLSPLHRVMWCPHRRPNPFFHLLESVWMLGGCDNLNFLTQFAPNFGQFSDDGISLRGAYGRRWKSYFGMDQINWAIETLKADHTTRRCVISMWSPLTDTDSMYNEKKDIPCNTTIYFSTREVFLDMTVCCRSNDMVWGAYGANVVHFSILHEVVSRFAGLSVGMYTQFSNDFHMYERHWDLLNHKVVPELYGHGVHPKPISTEGTEWPEFSAECEGLTQGATPSHSWLRNTCLPMMQAWECAADDVGRAVTFLRLVDAKDWRAVGAHYLGVPLAEVGL